MIETLTLLAALGVAVYNWLTKAHEGQTLGEIKDVFDN